MSSSAFPRSSSSLGLKHGLDSISWCSYNSSQCRNSWFSSSDIFIILHFGRFFRGLSSYSHLSQGRLKIGLLVQTSSKAQALQHRCFSKGQISQKAPPLRGPLLSRLYGVI